MKALGLVVSEKKIFFYVFPMTSWGVGGGTCYESSGPCGFGEEDFFYVFPIVCLWELMTPRAGPFLTPGAWLAEWQDLLKGPLHIFGEEDFFMFFP